MAQPPSSATRPYTVRAGDTLSRIAKRHGVGLSEILALNPPLRLAPDRLNIGQIVLLPGGGAATATMAKAATAAQSWQLGSLSTRYETGGRGATTVSGGEGDAGGVSYGSYQMTSKPNGGTVQAFVNHADFPWTAEFKDLTPGTEAFTKVWKDLATREATRFEAAEHDYIKLNFYDPLCDRILARDEVKIRDRSSALQDAIWSTAVHHGPRTTVVQKAFDQMRADGTFKPEAGQFDRLAIIAIYTERGRVNADGVLVYFSKNSANVQAGVAARFVKEQADALAMFDAQP
jgi:LysM repeat protein